MKNYFKENWIIFVIAFVFVLFLVIFPLIFNDTYDLYIYTNEDGEIILWNKDDLEKVVLSSEIGNYGEYALKATLTSDKEYVVFEDRISYDIEKTTYCLNYIEVDDAFSETDSVEVSCEVSDFVVTDDSIYYLVDETLYINDFNDDNTRLATNVSYLYGFDKIYYLTLNGGLYELDGDDIKKITSNVIGMIDYYDGKPIYVKNTSLEKLTGVAYKLYVGDEELTDTLLWYNGISKDSLYYTSIKKEVINDITTKKDYGKREITRLEDAKTNSEYTLYMIASKTCPHCARLNSVLEALASDYGFIYNYMDYPNLQSKVKEEVNNTLTTVDGYPILVIVKDGEVVAKHEGYSERSVIYEFLESKSDLVSVLLDDINYYAYTESYVYKDTSKKLFDGMLYSVFNNNHIGYTLSLKNIDNVTITKDNVNDYLSYDIFNSTNNQILTIDKAYNKHIFYSPNEDNYLLYLDDESKVYHLIEVDGDKYVDIELTKYVYNYIIDTSKYVISYENEKYNLYEIVDNKLEFVDECDSAYMYYKNDKLYYISDGNLIMRDKNNTKKLFSALGIIEGLDDLYFYTDYMNDEEMYYGDLYYLNGDKEVFIDADIDLSLGLVKLGK